MLTSSVVDGTDLVEAVVDGSVDAAALAALRRRMTEVAEQHGGGVRVLVEVRRFDGVQPRAVWEDLKSFGLLKILRRYAVVTPSAPLRAAAKGAFALLPVEGRVFVDRDEAVAWVRA